MAIAFRAVGARTKAASGGVKNVAMPAGVVAGDLLILVTTIDCRNDETVVSAGWNYLTSAGRYDQSFAHPWPRTRFYWKIATGGEGANQSVSYSTAGYPNGTPNVIAFIIAYSGTHQTTPIVDFQPDDTVGPSATVDHPILSITSTNSWLISFRSVSGLGARTFTCSVGTDAERVDDTDGFSELSVAYYDSNTTLATGPHTLRQTTASTAPEFGNNMSSIAIRPPTAAGTTSAAPTTATATGTAYNATVTTVTPAWDLCTFPIAAYTFAVDWLNDGDFIDPGDDVTGDILSGGVTFSYGRDQGRQLSPSSAGHMAFSVNNSTRTYSPENVSSPLTGTLDPARPAKGQVVFAGVTYPLFTGRIDEFTVRVDRTDRTADFTFMDGFSQLQANKLSTQVYQGKRTGEIVGYILDLVGWTGPRSLDVGATYVKYWWAEGTDALTALQEIVRSEGPPAIAYVAPDGTFTFRDRHHRLLRDHSKTSQGTFAAEMVDCAAPAITGAFHFTKPFVYERGWRDVINSVSLEIAERQTDYAPTAVWTSEDTLALSSGQSVRVEVSASDPFINAITPVSGTDFIKVGAGVVTATLSRTSGQSTAITYLCTGGSATISTLQLRAQAIPVVRTSKVSVTDSSSIASHGQKDYPDTVPWANANDAAAIAGLILLHYSNPRPIVSMRIGAEDPEHFGQILERTISDRITIRNDEMGLNSDFFVERVEHHVQRLWSDRPPVHYAVLGCEKDVFDPPDNPFTFDKKGAGFDDGVFDVSGSDHASSVFIFDDPQQGQFDFGEFGT